MDCCIFFARCNDFDFHVGRTIVVDRPKIAYRRVERRKVPDAVCISSPNYILRDVVPAFPYPGSDTFDSLFGCRKPKVKQGYKIAFRLRFLNEPNVGTGGQCRLECEILPFGQQIIHALQHQTSGFDGYAFGVERRKAFRNFIGIDEFLASQHFGQHCVGCSRFSRTVAACYDIKFRHILSTKIAIFVLSPARMMKIRAFMKKSQPRFTGVSWC